MTTTPSPLPGLTLHQRLATALDAGEAAPAALDALAGAEPVDRRDRLCTLLTIYDLHTGAYTARTAHADHPALATLTWQLERAWRAELGALDGAVPTEPAEVSAALRALAARDRLPAVYRWLADEATWPEVVRFLALEGGPDGGFDDLVALCQVGLTGAPKMEMATNYWDEMGNGDADEVHTTLHDRMVAAIGIRAIPRDEQPETALERSALGGLLATNRTLQPELVGALGLTELQAGPRCRLVLRAFDRCGAPEAAYPFYRVHAEVDPRHGKDWMERVVEPLVRDRPEWATGIVRGAVWRSRVNAAFFDEQAGARLGARPAA